LDYNNFTKLQEASRLVKEVQDELKEESPKVLNAVVSGLSEVIDSIFK
jgi:hypothetical protein